MNKIICNVCGTSYPENASQCPICGFARTSETNSGNADGSYTYVKGGRFSKSNVRKRNQVKAKEVSSNVTVAEMDTKEKTNVGSVILIIILLVAILAVVGYIAMRFFLPNDYLFEGLDNFTLPSLVQNTEDQPEEEPDDDFVSSNAESEDEPNEETLADCESISLNESHVELTAVGESFELVATLEPADASESVVFVSSDESVVTVDESGMITSTGEGSAVITVTCGKASAVCNVFCTVPTTLPVAQPLVLNRKEITFESEGQSWMLYDGELAPSDILWTSDDNAVATIENGKVVAVGSGDTTVYGIYNGTTASCIIHCKLDDEENEGGTGISEADDDTKRTYKLYNPYGRADDVTIKVGQKFTLKLVDEDKKEVSGVEWKVQKSKICSCNKGTVKGLASGTSKVTAVFDGKEYTCIVRVK